MSRRVDMHPSKVEANTDIVVFNEDGCYLLMADHERRQVITWIERMTCSTYDKVDDIMAILQGRIK